MFRALLYLRLTSFKNWLLTRAKSLRRPKTAIGLAVGFAYFYFFFVRGFGGSATRGARRAAAAKAMETAHVALPSDALPTIWLPEIGGLAAFALLVFVALMWIVPTRRASLGFTEAEIAFLFPAPITRRALVHFRLISGQLRSLIGATVMALVSNRWSFLGGNAATHALGWWFVFSALNLHLSGATFTLTRLGDAGLGTARRRLFVAVLVVAVFAATIARLPAAAHVPDAEGDAVSPFVDAMLDTAPLAWVLAPFRLVVAPFLAADTRAFLLALAPALLVIVAHYFWVVRAAVNFEESSLEQAEKRTARIAAWRSGQRRFGGTPTKGRAGPFLLLGTGRPELAFLWKNLLSTWPYFTPRVLASCAVIIAAFALWLGGRPGGRELLAGIGGFATMFAGYTLIAGPQFARQDIRSDLAHIDILKTYPLAGWQIVLGELLAPTAILTGLLWLALLTAALAFQPSHGGLVWLTPPVRVTTATALAFIAPALVCLQLLVPNAAALVFPGWFQATRARGGGVEVMGQRMIFFFAQVLTMALALLPAAAFAALLIFILQAWIGLAIAIAVAAIVVLAVLVGEAWCGLWLLGARFEKLDLSAELRP